MPFTSAGMTTRPEFPARPGREPLPAPRQSLPDCGARHSGTVRAKQEAVLLQAALALADGWRHRIAQRLHPHHLSWLSASALTTLRAMGGAGRPTDIARALAVNSGTVVRLVDALADAGLAERSCDAADRRVRKIHLTASGEATARQVDEWIHRERSNLLSHLADGELEETLSMVQRLADGLADERDPMSH